MNVRNLTCVFLSVLAMAAGCQTNDSVAVGNSDRSGGGVTAESPRASGKNGKSGKPGSNTSNTHPQRITAPPPPPVTYAVCSEQLPKIGQWKGDPTFLDVTGDGHLDLAAQPRLGNGPHIWAGDGQGHWKSVYAGWPMHDNSCGGGIVFIDVNKDGKLDMTVADHCRGVFVFLGDGSGEKWEPVTQNLYPSDIVNRDLENQTFLGAEDLDAGDVNGDGFVDLIVNASDESGINLYMGDGTGKNWRRQPCKLPTKAWANRVMLFDMNKDDLPDVVANHADGPRVFLNNGQGDWTDGWAGLPSPVIRGLYTGITVADFNEDGKPDIATANWVDGPEVYLQQADGSWKKSVDVFPEMLGGAMGIAAGDLDRDGHQDIVASGQMKNEPGYVRGVFALRGNGKGEFTHMKDCGLPDTGLMTSMGIALGDVNGDGRPDIAVGSGMPVERVPSGPSGPAIPYHLIVWCSQVPAKEASLTATCP